MINMSARIAKECLGFLGVSVHDLEEHPAMRKSDGQEKRGQPCWSIMQEQSLNTRCSAKDQDPRKGSQVGLGWFWLVFNGMIGSNLLTCILQGDGYGRSSRSYLPVSPSAVKSGIPRMWDSGGGKRFAGFHLMCCPLKE